MRPFKFGKKNEMFVPELDAEHRNMFRLAGELHVAIESAAPPERVRPLLDALLADTEEHFAHEERLMRAAAYPAYDWHRQQHDTLRKRARGFVAQWENGDHESAPMLLEFLAVWLKDHTGVADRMLGASLRNYQRLAS